MVKNNPEAAVVAIALVVAVTIHATAFMGTPHEPSNETTAAMPVKVAPPEQNHHIPPPTILYDVPLDVNLQLHIIRVAESYGIDPAIIFAMCYRESGYNPSSIGDHGAAFGLMQIQPKWHSDRMARLGCTDLLDPYQNVIVGADYLAEQLTRYGGDMCKALVAYNAGHYKGTITRYAIEVMEVAEELRGTTYEAENEGRTPD